MYVNTILHFLSLKTTEFSMIWLLVTLCCSLQSRKHIHTIHKNTHTVSDRLTSGEKNFWLASTVFTWIRERDEKQDKRDTDKELKEIVMVKSTLHQRFFLLLYEYNPEIQYMKTQGHEQCGSLCRPLGCLVDILWGLWGLCLLMYICKHQ